MGYVFYEGPSTLDGEPIVGIITDRSTNTKTGQLLQTWILRADMDPIAASQQSADVSICGDCPLRHSLGGGCYVVLLHGPQSVYRKYTRGGYRPFGDDAAFAVAWSLGVRLGAYGDPVAIPYWAWRPVIRTARKTVGYTHQWRSCPQFWRDHLMASVETLDDAREAQAMGWRTFRIGAALPGEMLCPASEEAGKLTTCSACMACNGQRANVVIAPHGIRKARIER